MDDENDAENKEKAVELTDEETEKAVGGYCMVGFSFYCPRCKVEEEYQIDADSTSDAYPVCRHCGGALELST